MPGVGPNLSFAPYERPVRAAFVGLGRIYDLNVRAYVDNPDVEVVALVDPSEKRRAQRRADWPAARTFTSAAELAASGLEVDAVEVLLPIPLHADGVAELVGYGWHVNLQKPICNDLADANRMLGAAAAGGRLLRVMDNYIFYEPLVKLKEIVASGELGEVRFVTMQRVNLGLHQKDVSVIWDLAAHDMAILDYWLGEMPGIVGSLGRDCMRDGIPDVVAVGGSTHNVIWYRPTRRVR